MAFYGFIQNMPKHSKVPKNISATPIIKIQQCKIKYKLFIKSRRKETNQTRI